MPDQSTDMERAPDINSTEVEAIGEVLASLEVGDGDDVSGTNSMSIHLRTLANNTPANAATGATPSPPAHTVPTQQQRQHRYPVKMKRTAPRTPASLM